MMFLWGLLWSFSVLKSVLWLYKVYNFRHPLRLFQVLLHHLTLWLLWLLRSFSAAPCLFWIACYFRTFFEGHKSDLSSAKMSLDRIYSLFSVSFSEVFLSLFLMDVVRCWSQIKLLNSHGKLVERTLNKIKYDTLNKSHFHS